MRTLVFVPILIAIVSSNAVAEVAADCAAMPDDAKRLLCYDLIFKVKRSSTTASKWVVEQEVSKIDDSKNVFVSLTSNEPLSSRFGKKQNARLLFSCREGKTTAYITFGGHFMSSLQHGTVTYRVDKRPAKQRRMTESTDHQALGLWTAGDAIPLARELFGAETLYLQATPHSESPVSAEFPIAGLEEAIKPLQTTCKWPTAEKKPAQTVGKPSQ